MSRRDHLLRLEDAVKSFATTRHHETRLLPQALGPVLHHHESVDVSHGRVQRQLGQRHAVSKHCDLLHEGTSNLDYN
jgi:hypothetical protein